MNVEIKKLKRSIYLASIFTLLAVFVLLWVFTRSTVTIKTSPADASVFIDGKEITNNNAGSFRVSLDPGVHNIKVEAEDYMGYVNDIKFNRGFLKTFNINLKEAALPIEINKEATLLSKGSDFNDGYYLGDGGRTLYKAKIGTTEEGKVRVVENKPITANKLSGIKEIIWSPTKELALFRKANGDINLFDFMKYDFVHQTENLWGQDIGNIAWAPDNSKIAYYYAPASGERTLVFANLTNSEIIRASDFKESGIENPILHWSPDSEWLLIISQSSDKTENNLYLFNAYSRTLKQLTDSGNIVDASFSPDGNKILYSTYSKDPSNPIPTVLSVMDKKGENKKSLDLRAELRKTAWNKNSKEIVVATYNNETGKESIFEINVETNQNSGFVLKNIGDVFIESIFISDDSKMLMYQTKNGIYALMVE